MVKQMSKETCIEELVNGINMGILAIDHLIDKIENPKLRDVVINQRKEYSDLKEKIIHTSPHIEDETKKKFIIESIIELKAMMSDDQKITKMLIEGCNQSMITMTHLINKEERHDMTLKNNMNDFEDISKRYIEELKIFL